MKRKIRCGWVGDDPLMRAYHDREWGTPVHEDRTLFEFLILEGAQAGLSWKTVLDKRENFRTAFDHFDPKKIAHYTKRDMKRLLANPGIIRNRLKIKATINNAQKFLEAQKEFGSFDRYIWRFVDHRPIQHKFKSLSELPTRTVESDMMSKDLKKRGFKFVGSTICYAFMQAVGMVNDHTINCFRYNQLRRKK
ncbi:MAG: DNA-3-methyladenine glycosylase I [candidate division WOR-3 bacterium]|nr:MAG: DNA-3-methyladenine glycosylase I [candidate division WOR-3 bacterium]